MGSSSKQVSNIRCRFLGRGDQDDLPMDVPRRRARFFLTLEVGDSRGQGVWGNPVIGRHCAQKVSGLWGWHVILKTFHVCLYTRVA